MPAIKLPKFNLKYLGAAFASVSVLALTLLGLELLGRATHHPKPVKREAITITRTPQRPVVKTTSSTPKKLKKVVASAPKKKVRRVKRVKIKPVVQKPIKKEEPLESKAQVIAQRNEFKKEFVKLISKKAPYLKECMSYETSTKKKDLSLSFHLAARKGRARKILFNEDLSQLTKSCLSALYADIIFPQHPSQKEIEIVQHFSFEASNTVDDVDESIFL